MKLQRGKNVVIADLSESDGPLTSHAESADIVRYAIVDFADMLMNAVEGIDFSDGRGFVEAFEQNLPTHRADTQAGGERRTYTLLR